MRARTRPGAAAAGAAAGLPVAGTAALVAGWWGVTAVFRTPAFLLPSPPQVVAVFVERPGVLARHAGVTAAEVLQGYALAVGLGLLIGVALAGSPPVARAALPSLVGLDAIPKLALAPLLVVWLGFGQAPKIAMVVATCLLPVVLSTIAGLTGTPAEQVELARSLRASWWRTLRAVRLPYALPAVFTGLRIAAPLAVIGAVIGEFFGALAGLGYLIRGAGADTPLVFAALALLAALSLTLFYLVAGVERRLLPWTRHTTA